MWKCKKCQEGVEDSFELCWNCGTSKEGLEDPSFRKADESGALPADAEPIRLEAELAPESEAAPENRPPLDSETAHAGEHEDLDVQLEKRFVCSKCSNRGASVKRFAATGTGVSRLYDIQHNEFIAVSCTNCGFTEIYNPEILDGKGVIMDILDLVFGR